jgi:hypothetical protein
VYRVEDGRGHVGNRLVLRLMAIEMSYNDRFVLDRSTIDVKVFAFAQMCMLIGVLAYQVVAFFCCLSSRKCVCLFTFFKDRTKLSSRLFIPIGDRIKLSIKSSLIAKLVYSL